MKIARKISLSFFVVIFILTLTGGTFFYLIAKESLQKSARDNLAAVLASRRDHIETYLKMLKISVGQLSKSLILTDFLKINAGESPRRNELFERTTKRLTITREANPAIIEFLLMDTTGKVVASSNVKDVGSDGSASSIFLGSRKETYLKDVHFSEEYKEPLMAVSTPFLDNRTGEFLGVLAARVKLNDLENIAVARTGLGDTGEVYIVNKYGYMITPSRFKKGASLKQKVIAEAFCAYCHAVETNKLEKSRLQQTLSDHKMAFIFPNYLGTRVLGTFEYIPEMEWSVLAEISEKESLAPLARMRLLFLMILLITPFTSALLGHFVSRLITGPLHRLQVETQIIGAGDLDHKVGTLASDEVGQLSRAFDLMTNNLKRTTASIEMLRKEKEEHRTAETALRESEKRFYDVFYASKDAILLIRGNKFVDANEATARLLGYATQEVFLLKHPSELSPPTQPDGRASFEKGEEMMRLAFEKGSHQFEWMHRKASGEDFPVRVSFTPVMLKGEQILHCVWIDLTRQKQDERLLLEFQYRLKSQAEQLTVSLEETDRSRKILSSMLDDNNMTREKLEKSLKNLKEAHGLLARAEKMEAVGRMASGVAHEVKNPLGIILQGINYLEGALPPEEQDHHKMLRMMKDSIKRADKIVRGLLDFSKDHEPNMELQDINTVIESSLELVQHELKLDSVEVVRALAKNLPKALLDKVKLEEVFVNLFNNAVDAMPGGGKLYIRSYLPETRAKEEEAEDKMNAAILKLGKKVIVVEVEDTGAGIDESVIHKVFDPFFTTKGRTEGTGLGLSIAKSIMDSHEGWIDLESIKGKGTKFTLAFKIP